MEDSYEKKVLIPRSWFDDNPNGVFWIEDMNKGVVLSHTKRQFHPRGILINGTSGYAEVSLILHDEGPNDWDIYRLEVGRIHRLSVQAIREINTDHLEIKILA